MILHMANSKDSVLKNISFDSLSLLLLHFCLHKPIGMSGGGTQHVMPKYVPAVTSIDAKSQEARDTKMRLAKQLVSRLNEKNELSITKLKEATKAAEAAEVNVKSSTTALELTEFVIYDRQSEKTIAKTKAIVKKKAADMALENAKAVEEKAQHAAKEAVEKLKKAKVEAAEVAKSNANAPANEYDVSEIITAHSPASSDGITNLMSFDSVIKRIKEKSNSPAPINQDKPRGTELAKAILAICSECKLSESVISSINSFGVFLDSQTVHSILQLEDVSITELDKEINFLTTALKDEKVKDYLKDQIYRFSGELIKLYSDNQNDINNIIRQLLQLSMRFGVTNVMIFAKFLWVSYNGAYDLAKSVLTIIDTFNEKILWDGDDPETRKILNNVIIGSKNILADAKKISPGLNESLNGLKNLLMDADRRKENSVDHLGGSAKTRSLRKNKHINLINIDKNTILQTHGLNRNKTISRIIKKISHFTRKS